MDYKFKIGDKVRVRTPEESNVEFSGNQLPRVGKIGIILDECELPDVRFGNDIVVFDEKKLELATEEDRVRSHPGMGNAKFERNDAVMVKKFLPGSLRSDPSQVKYPGRVGYVIEACEEYVDLIFDDGKVITFCSSKVEWVEGTFNGIDAPYDLGLNPSVSYSTWSQGVEFNREYEDGTVWTYNEVLDQSTAIDSSGFSYKYKGIIREAVIAYNEGSEVEEAKGRIISDLIDGAMEIRKKDLAQKEEQGYGRIRIDADGNVALGTAPEPEPKVRDSYLLGNSLGIEKIYKVGNLEFDNYEDARRFALSAKLEEEWAETGSSLTDFLQENKELVLELLEVDDD